MSSWAVLFATLFALVGIIMGGQLMVDPTAAGEPNEERYAPPPDPLEQGIRIAPDATERAIADALQAPLMAMWRAYKGQNVEITEAMRPYIAQISDAMAPHHHASLTVSVFATDYALAQQRAEQVQNAFVQAGLPAYVMFVQGEAGTPGVFVTP
ncbi:MAG: hypothetical protein AAGJ10_14805 [Bacteroidota bacterium]